MLKRIIWICALIALVAWIAQTKIENGRVKDEERAEAQRISSKIKSNVAALAKANGATSNWVKSLSNGEEYGFKRILTIELEKEWANGSAILFLGVLNDIATLDDSHYQVRFEQSLWSSLDTMFDAELKLSLKAEKSIIDKFMSTNPNLLEDYWFNNGVAVAAQIEEIESSQIADTEGLITEVKTGKGILLGLVFTGDTQL